MTHQDSPRQHTQLSAKVNEPSILDDERSAANVGAPLCVTIQFTLYADTSRGRRPSWGAAAPSAVAEPLVAAVVDALRGRGARVETGRFGAMMQVELVNDGPMTLLLDV